MQSNRNNFFTAKKARRSPALLWGGCVALLVAGVSVQPVAAHTPESEYVQSMVRPACDYLEEGFFTEEFGGEALVAMTLVKAGRSPEGRRVQHAIKEVQAFLATNPRPESPFKIYSSCVALILLAEVSPQKYRREIEQLVDLIVGRQTAIGAWGYNGRNTGDVSQTQYCVLALWTAQKKGFRVDPNVGKAALNWLMTVQDIEGGWPYQGIYRGNLNRIQQSGITPSLTAAGLGSVYIAADWLGYGKDPDAGRQQSDGLPPGVTIVTDEEEEDDPKIQVNTNALRACKQQGNAWFGPQPPMQIEIWTYYYLYGFERYASFREMAENIDDPEPDWYNRGCEFLKGSQEGTGAWKGSNSEEPNPVATAFAVLFLIRNTKKSLGLAEYTDGTLRGGQGLRDDAEVALRNGKLVSIPVAKDLPQLMAMLENPDEDELEFFAESVKELDLSSDKLSKTQQRAALYNLVNQKQYTVRLIAVRTLGSEPRMENVPPLIYALTDPNFEVARAAHEGLLAISRKLAGFELPAEATTEDFKAMKKRWTDWYLDVVPEGELLD